MILLRNALFKDFEPGGSFFLRHFRQRVASEILVVIYYYFAIQVQRKTVVYFLNYTLSPPQSKIWIFQTQVILQYISFEVR